MSQKTGSNTNQTELSVLAVKGVANPYHDGLNGSVPNTLHQKRSHLPVTQQYRLDPDFLLQIVY